MARHDSLAIRYGNKFIDQYDGNDQSNLVKSHMRLIMRVLFQMKLINNEITNLESAFKPGHFDVFIKAVRIICKAKKKVLGVEYNGHTIRTLWNQHVVILKSKYSKMSDRIYNFYSTKLSTSTNGETNHSCKSSITGICISSTGDSTISL